MGINKINLNTNVDSLLNKYGLKLIENDGLHLVSFLPERIDLKTYTKVNYENKNEAAKLRLIKKFTFSENHLEITNWESFLPNLKVSKDQERILRYIFAAVRIYYLKGNFVITFHNLIDFLAVDIFNNKDFMKLLSNNFQFKLIFSPKQQMYVGFRKEILTLIESKLEEFNIKEKCNVELLKLIMNYLDEQSE